jgi:hypothetical protein
VRSHSSLAVDRSNRSIGSQFSQKVTNMITPYIPKDLKKKVEDYFHSDHWFYVNHPRLNYQSPARCLKNGIEPKIIEQIFNEEVKEWEPKKAKA